jgi:hypothetical protein
VAQEGHSVSLTSDVGLPTVRLERSTEGTRKHVVPDFIRRVRVITPSAEPEVYVTLHRSDGLTSIPSEAVVWCKGADLSAWHSGMSTQLFAFYGIGSYGFVASDLQTEIEPSRWKAYVERRLTRLESGTDHEDADRPYPTPAVLHKARTLTLQLFTNQTPTPSVVPAETGGVAFVWHKGGLDIEIEVNANESEDLVWIYSRESKRSFQWTLSTCFPIIKAVLQSLETV